MTFEQTIAIPAPPAAVWDFVMDVPEVAKCLPGAGNVESLGDDRYAVTVKVKVGPIGLTLQSEIAIVSADPVTRTAALRLDANDKRVGGAVKATMTMRLTDANGGTEMRVATDATVMGRIGDFGQPMIRKKADQMLNETGDAIRAALAQRSATT
jgi:carbon monoxide dehydrogenase subunit G